MSALPLEHPRTGGEPDCDCPGTSRRALLRGAALVGATTMFGTAAVTVGPAAAAAPRRTPSNAFTPRDARSTRPATT